MKILLGSKNPSKKRSVEMALEELEIIDYEIECFDVNSLVDDFPIGYEMIRGAINRIENVKTIALEKGIKYDYICGIEGGYEVDGNAKPFVTTYAVVEDKTGKRSTGKSMGLRLTIKMFEFIRNGGSLNRLIEEIDGNSKNNCNDGITGYLTNGKYRRDKFDKDAIISSLIPLVYNNNRDKLDREVKKKMNMATFDDFLKLDIKVGKIIKAEDFIDVKKPAYKVWVDFGELGIKKTSAQITECYKLDELVGMQVLGVVNFPPKQVKDFMSEFLLLGVYSNNGVVLITPTKEVNNGDKLG